MASAEPTDDKTRYESLRKELVATLPKKRALDKQLAQVEANIYALETRYLLDTAAHSGGNIIHGFEGYLKNQGAARKRIDVHESDRVFSNSSASFQKSLDLLNEGDEDTAPPTPNPNGVSTISIPPAPISVSITKKDPRSAAATKREKDREYSRKRRAASRMSTETGSGGEESVTGGNSSGRRQYKRARVGDD